LDWKSEISTLLDCIDPSFMGWGKHQTMAAMSQMDVYALILSSCFYSRLYLCSCLSNEEIFNFLVNKTKETIIK